MNGVQHLAAWAVRWQAWAPAGLFLAAAAWEAWRPGRVRALGRGWRWATNLGLWFGDGWLVAALGLANVAAALLAWARVPHLALFAAVHDAAGPWGVLVAGCLALDLAGYLLHRLSHRVFVLWRLHAVHHADADVDASTAVRHHPLEVLVTGLATLVLALALGVPPGVFAVYALLAVAVQLFQHANLRLPAAVEAALGRVVMTPGLHRAHHSVLPQHYNMNFGTVLSVWDRWLGTLAPPLEGAAAAAGYGVAPFLRPWHARPWWALALPFLLAPGRTQAQEEARKKEAGFTPQRQ